MQDFELVVTGDSFGDETPKFIWLSELSVLYRYIPSFFVDIDNLTL